MRYLILLFIVSFSSCQFLVKTGNDMCSESVEMSKELGVFVTEYSIIYIDSSFMYLPFIISEAWIEKRWYYKNQFRDIDIWEGLENFNIRIDSLKISSKEWRDYVHKIKVEGVSGYAGLYSGCKLFAHVDEHSDTIKFIFPKNNIVLFVKQ